MPDEDEKVHLTKTISVGNIISSVVQAAIVIWVVAVAYTTTQNRIDRNALNMSALESRIEATEINVRAIKEAVQEQEVSLGRISENISAIRYLIEQRIEERPR